jgi:hypothetical protein
MARHRRITADKREINNFPQIAFGNFFYPQTVIYYFILSGDSYEENF